jgi:hypothetical protein
LIRFYWTYKNLPSRPRDIERATDAFNKALPTLLAANDPSYQWVAFYHDQQIAVGKTKTEVGQQCLRQGYQRGTFIVRAVEPDVSNEAEMCFYP